MTYIGLIDCNNFFVSCERVFRPDLVGKPVVVLSGNDGCVVARSQEVKDKNIPMGAPYFQVKDTLSFIGATIFSSHFALYRDFSRRVFEVVKAELGTIEQYSIDECFFALDEEGAEEKMVALKRKIWQSTGIPVSIGLAHSKTRAKYASVKAKKTNGVTILSHKDWESLAENIKLAELWGVGHGRAKQFARHNLSTVKDFCLVPRATIDQLYGIEGLRLQGELLGKAVFTLERKVTKQKSYMSTGSFPKSTTDYGVLEQALRHHVYEIAKDLSSNEQLASKVRVLIYPGKYSDYVLQGASKELTMTTGTNDIFQLQKQVSSLLKSCFIMGVPYKRAGVIVSDISDTNAASLSLFATETKTAAVSEVLFLINKKHGRTTLRLGALEKKVQLWQSQKDLLSPDYTTSWNDLRVVR